ncbi:MAG: DUF4350 domain-containing protein [Halobacteriaceae archaeon]
MRASEIGKRLGLVAVVMLLVGAAAAMPIASHQNATTDTSLSIASHQPANILADVPAETGTITIDGGDGSKRVLIDAGHGNQFDRAEIAPMIDALTSAGHEVSLYRDRSGSSLNESLRGADAFVVLSPEEPFTSDQLDGLQAFSDAGGRVLLAGEPPRQGSGLSILFGLSSPRGGTAPFTGLAASFGFSVGDGYLYDIESYDGNYRNVYASPSGDTVLGDVGEVTIHEGVAIRGGTPLLSTVETARVSSDREARSYPVVARNGAVVAVGDTSIFSTEWNERSNNEALVGSLLEFLVSGDKESGAPTPPDSTESGEPAPPTRRQ